MRDRASVQVALEPDFRLLFQAVPTPSLILEPDFRIAAVNDAYLRATKTVREEILGRPLFEVFPDNPDEPDASGVRNLSASLHRVLRNQAPDAMAVQKYDIPLHGEREGEFELRYWQPLNTPVFNGAGQLVYIIHQVEDVTAASLKQQATEESEARFRQIANAMPQIVWSSLPNGCHDYFNQQWYDYTGAPPGLSEGDEGWAPLFHPDDRSRILARWQHSLASGEAFEVEYRLRHRSGEYRWALGRALPIRDAHGVIERWLGTSTDIHPQKLAEEERRRADAKFMKIVEAGIIGIYEYRLDGSLVAVNDKFLEMVGYSREDFERHGLSWRDLTPPDWEEVDRCASQSVALTGKTRPFEKEYFRKDGSRVPVMVGATCLDDCKQTAIAYVLDISQLKQAQLETQQSEIRFRTLAENIPQLAWMADSDGSVFWFNNRWLEYTGTTLEEMQGWGWTRVHHPDWVDGVRQRYTEQIVQRQLTWEDTFPLRSRQGEYRWFLSRAVPIRDEHGRIVRWLGTSTDITDQRHAREALQQENRSKDDFLAMLAHELRNPLAPISAAADLLKLASEEQKVHRASDIIGRQVRHLTELVDDLMDVSRVTRGLVLLEKAQVSFKSVIDGALEQAMPLIESRKHVLVSRLAAADALVLGDATRLVQVVTNLLNNSAKYTPRGGEIRLELEVTPDELHFSVADNGIGMDAALLPHVFDLFIQARRTPERSVGGLGLGLALVKSIMTMHGGSVTATSEGLGKGSTFTLVLPLAHARDAHAGPRLATAE